MTEKYKKLIIGTAQWGLDYGISNRSGKTNKEEVASILNTANKYGINTLDTASAYGDAEKIIGKLSKDNSKIITKIGIGDQALNSEQSKINIRNRIANSYANVGSRILEGVLIHDPNNLEASKDNYKWDLLKEMKEEGYTRKIGISVYNPIQAEKLAIMYKPDIIQMPFNAFDKKATNLGTLRRLKDDGVEIHARSIFLQGLLLMDIQNINEYFTPWMAQIKEWHKYCFNNGLTLLEGAIANVMEEENIEKFTVGIEDTSQLEQIIEATKKTVGSYYEVCSTTGDEGLINPSRWRLKK